MEKHWADIAVQAVAGLGVEVGEVVLLRDGAGRPEVLTEFLLAVEQRGATPYLELVTPAYLMRLLKTVPPHYLEQWDQHRLPWVQRADRLLVLEGMKLDTASIAPEALAAWSEATGRLGAIDEQRQVPYLLVAIPTTEQAVAMGCSVLVLEEQLLPALAIDSTSLRHVIDSVRSVVAGARTMTVNSGDGCVLRLTLGNRPWLDDDGVIGQDDRERNTQIVMNLPAGVLYTTVLEEETDGQLRLPSRHGSESTTLRFEQGQVVAIEGDQASSLQAMFERHSGDARRISHIGIGLNPALPRPLGWPLVDIHAYGQCLIAFGENRYLGGTNASSLNVDFALPGATLAVDRRVIVQAGRLVV